MSSLNDYIRFALDIEDHNIVFKDYFYKILNGTKYKIYEAELIQPVLFVAQLVWFITDTLRSTYAISLLMLVSLS